MQDFKKFKVWEKSHQLTLEIYRLTGKYPRHEAYGLTSQVRRSSASIATNIAEGCGRGSNKEMKRLLTVAMGSASQTEYHLLLSRDLKCLPGNEYDQLHQSILEIKRMFFSLINKLTTEN
jgi:four helix bundle protein